MDKLLDLLNEYERSKGTNLEITNWKGVYGNLSYFGYGNGYSEFLCISKRYGFIQWLVDNNKIDKEKVWKNESPDIFDYSFYEVVLMLLSISSTPIEDLISYLR